MKKVPVKEFQESYAKKLFGMTKDEAHRQGICICCKRAIDKSSMTEINENMKFRDYVTVAIQRRGKDVDEK